MQRQAIDCNNYMIPPVFKRHNIALLQAANLLNGSCLHDTPRLIALSLEIAIEAPFRAMRGIKAENWGEARRNLQECTRGNLFFWGSKFISWTIEANDCAEARDFLGRVIEKCRFRLNGDHLVKAARKTAFFQILLQEYGRRIEEKVKIKCFKKIFKEGWGDSFSYIQDRADFEEEWKDLLVRVSSVTSFGKTPLILTSREAVFTLYLNNVALSQTFRKGRNLLHEVAKQGNILYLKKIFQSCRDTAINCIDEQDAEGNTPLSLAVREQRLDCVDFLLKHSANPRVQNLQGESPKSFCLKKCYRSPECKQKILGACFGEYYISEMGFDQSIRERRGQAVEEMGKLCLLECCLSKNTDYTGDRLANAKELVDWNVNPNIFDEEGNTPLFLIMNNPYFSNRPGDVLGFFQHVRENVIITHMNRYQQNILQVAASKGFTGVVNDVQSYYSQGDIINQEEQAGNLIVFYAILRNEFYRFFFSSISVAGGNVKVTNGANAKAAKGADLAAKLFQVIPVVGNMSYAVISTSVTRPKIYLDHIECTEKHKELARSINPGCELQEARQVALALTKVFLPYLWRFPISNQHEQAQNFAYCLMAIFSECFNTELFSVKSTTIETCCSEYVEFLRERVDSFFIKELFLRALRNEVFQSLENTLIDAVDGQQWTLIQVLKSEGRADQTRGQWGNDENFMLAIWQQAEEQILKADCDPVEKEKVKRKKLKMKLKKEKAKRKLLEERVARLE